MLIYISYDKGRIYIHTFHMTRAGRHQQQTDQILQLQKENKNRKTTQKAKDDAEEVIILSNCSVAKSSKEISAHLTTYTKCYMAFFSFSSFTLNSQNFQALLPSSLSRVESE